MPNMGMRAKTSAAIQHTSLSAALFSNTQQRVLGLLFGQPDRSFFATELIGLSGGGSGAVQRELKRLDESGLVTVKRVGSQKHYQANPQSPIFTELCSIVHKTAEPVGPLPSQSSRTEKPLPAISDWQKNGAWLRMFQNAKKLAG
jgi:hypothetical protein